MDSTGSTNMTTFDVTAANFMNDNWFSVRAKEVNSNAVGRRAIAINQPSGLMNCAAMPPQSVFQVPAQSCLGQTITLQDQSLNAPTSWEWTITPSTFSFVNGTNANSQSPDVNFSTTDIYTITLVTTNFAGTDTSTQIVDVSYAFPLAAFTPQPGGLTYIFVNQSTGGFYYTWDFGDGGSSTLQHPSHTYATSGTYTVRLTVSSPCGTVTSSKFVTVIGTGLENLFEGAEVKVYPNPSQGIFPPEYTGTASGSTRVESCGHSRKNIESIRFQAHCRQLKRDLGPQHLCSRYLLPASPDSIWDRQHETDCEIEPESKSLYQERAEKRICFLPFLFKKRCQLKSHPFSLGTDF